MPEQYPTEPRYQLVERGDAVPHCEIHAMEELADVHNSPDWTVTNLGVDKIRYECKICGSIRVYRILPEKTLL